MASFFLRLYDILSQRKALFTGLLLGLVMTLFLMMFSLSYNENIYDFLPLSGNEQKAINVYQDISGGQRIYAMIKTKDGKPNRDLQAEAIDTLAAKLNSQSGRRHIKEIITQIDYEKYANISTFIYQNMPVMLRDSDYVRMERLLATPNYAKDQLANDVEMMLMPASGFFTSNIGNDPLALFSPVLNRLQVQQSVLSVEVDNGYIYINNDKYAVAMLTSPYGAMESANNSLLVEYVDSVVNETMKAVPDVDVAITGAPVIAVGNANQIKSDSHWAITIAITLILTLLIFAFRKVKNLLLIGVSILFGWLFAMGLISVIRSDVSLIVIGIGSMIIGIAVNYPLHFIAHTDRGGTAREILKEMVAPLLIGNITTVGAFASLMPLDAPALRDLGIFAALMLVGTILFVLIFLPHLVKVRAEVGEERLVFGRISSGSPERHRWLLWVIFILTLFFGYYSLDTSFDTNMHHINYMTDQQKQLLGDMNASVGINDTVNVYVVTEGADWNEALHERLKLTPLLEQLKQNGALNGYSDVTSLICSETEQQQRIQRWNEFWKQHRTEVQSMLQAHASEFGFSDEAFEGFDEIITKDYSPKPFDYFEPVRSVFLNNSFSTNTGRCAVIDVINAGGKDHVALESTLNEHLGSKGFSFDFVRMNGAVASTLSDNFNYIGFACGFIVFIFLWLSFGRLELSLLAFLPMAIGWIWILGIMVLFGMKFNIVNVILATFIFGQGDDYTIFITDGLINEYAYRKKLLPSYKNSIVISALIMFIGMGSLIVAKHPALHSLAEVTIVGMFTVVLMAWVIPPFIFGWLTKTNNRIRRTPVTIEQIIRIIYCTVVYLTELLYGSLFGLVVSILPDKNKKKEAWFHRIIHKSMQVDVNHIWGVPFNVHNEVDEQFEKGSIIICNHQSMLDPIYILSLNPRILIMAGDRVWRNRFVRTMFKVSRFMNARSSVENIEQQVAQAVADGYSVVIFPEGLRSNEGIKRFHKGAFYLSRKLGVDLLPMYIHGTGHVMPKGSGLASRGQVDLVIGERIPADRLGEYGDTELGITKRIQHLYMNHYEQIRRQIENTHYFHHYIISKHIYKGIGVEKETRQLLKRYDDFSKWIDDCQLTDADSNKVSVIHAGKGQFSLLMALVHPEWEIHSYADDPDEVALAASCEPKPANLHVHLASELNSATATSNIIDLSRLLKENE
jgi:1-acyl-sn-glycerol-3-phosphate acyltransferase